MLLVRFTYCYIFISTLTLILTSFFKKALCRCETQAHEIVYKKEKCLVYTYKDTLYRRRCLMELVKNGTDSVPIHICRLLPWVYYYDEKENRKREILSKGIALGFIGIFAILYGIYHLILKF